MSKITKDELKSLNEQEKKKAAIRNDLGVLEIQIEQDKLKDSLEKSYGKINVDLKDGSYTLVEEKEE